MNATELMHALDSLLRPFDEKSGRARGEFLVSRRPFIAEASEATKGKDAWTRYPALFAAAGGKGNYELIRGNSDEMIREIAFKDAIASGEARNAKIAAKLAKEGVRNVISSEVVHSHDGFNGVYEVETDAGAKKVRVEVIGAGGYNVQCYHLRVLVKIK